MLTQLVLNTLTMFWYGAIAVAITFGWMLREQRYLVAESGLGYWLGIFGGLMMLLLLVYPLRKRRPQWRYLGSVKFWFRFHMLLGVAGPALIIFHSGYRLGSLNSRVAFFSMLIVAISGLVGRYLYRSIHHGLYGEKIRFEELYHPAEIDPTEPAQVDDQYAEITAELSQLEQNLVNRHTGINRNYWFYRNARKRVDRLRKQVNQNVVDSEVQSSILSKLHGLRSICRFGINEILFSYWHILHFPLFIMLVFSGLSHVAVVHFY